VTDAVHATRPYEFILIDANLPDSFAMAQKSAAQGTTVIMLVSMARPEDIGRCDEAGLAHLLKPVKHSELLDALTGGAFTSEEKSAGTSAAARVAPLRILLAEDGVVNQKLAVALLQKHGHQVLVAANGREAVALAQLQRFDLVLMDVLMPEMDGLEATRAIRAAENLTGRHVPIVAMTAHALREDRERCLKAGMDGYVSKPIRAQQLFETIETVLGARSAMPQPAPVMDAPANNVVDWAAALALLGGSADVLRELAELLIEECPRLLATIANAVAARDAKALRLSAHTFKGSVSHLGPTAASVHAQNLEMMGKSTDLTNAERELAALQRTGEELLAVLKGFLGRG
jgi:CheY-like chemotaxis protein